MASDSSAVSTRLPRSGRSNGEDATVRAETLVVGMSGEGDGSVGRSGGDDGATGMVMGWAGRRLRRGR